jgi:DNA-binding transcriptional ArsR family regulator
MVDVSTMNALAQDMTNSLDLVFAALADPTRRAILTMLLEDDMAVTDVAEPFQMSLAAISKHLTILTRSGLVAQEKRGRVKWCKLQPDALRAASVWMQGFGQFEPVNLDAFERFLATELPNQNSEVNSDPISGLNPAENTDDSTRI